MLLVFESFSLDRYFFFFTNFPSIYTPWLKFVLELRFICLCLCLYFVCSLCAHHVFSHNYLFVCLLEPSESSGTKISGSELIKFL